MWQCIVHVVASWLVITYHSLSNTTLCHTREDCNINFLLHGSLNWIVAVNLSVPFLIIFGCVVKLLYPKFRHRNKFLWKEVFLILGALINEFLCVVSDRKGTEQDCAALAPLGRTLIPAMRSHRTYHHHHHHHHHHHTWKHCGCC